MISKISKIIQKVIPQVWAQNFAPGLPNQQKAPSPDGGWGGQGTPKDFAKLSDLEFVFHRLISALFFAGGLVAFVYLIIGGFKYLTSSGDEDAMEIAKKTITYAVIGLLIVILSWLILATLGKSLNLAPDKFILFDIPQ